MLHMYMKITGFPFFSAMSDTKLKPLYMAKSLEELNKKIGGEKIKLATPKTYVINQANKLSTQ